MDYLITVALLALSALFSGLTLGLMGLDLHILRRKARLGNKRAAVILPVRERGNQLLATLILCNVALNAVLAVFLGSITSGVIAGIIATVLIFIFAEIMPQAYISRHALSVGSRMAPFVQFLMRASSPITYPIGAALDRLLGDELPTLYSKREIMEIVSEHEDSEHSTIDGDEERIVHGALKFSNKTVMDVMTPREEVVTLEEHQALNASLCHYLTEQGYSRYPVRAKDDDHIIGILYTKDVLIAEDTATVGTLCDHTHLTARPSDTLDVVLAHMLKRRLHMAVVRDEVNTFLGVITLEDIIEEVIQQEILDEDDDESTSPFLQKEIVTAQ